MWGAGFLGGDKKDSDAGVPAGVGGPAVAPKPPSKMLRILDHDVVLWCPPLTRNSAHTRQSGPYPGLGFHVEVERTFQVVPSSLGSEGGHARTQTPAQTLLHRTWGFQRAWAGRQWRRSHRPKCCAYWTMTSSCGAPPSPARLTANHFHFSQPLERNRFLF